MDASVWGRLSGDLVDAVITFLPVFSLLRFRVVCKYWCSLIDSPSLRKTSAAIEGASPLMQSSVGFLVHHSYNDGRVNVQFCTYDLVVDQWQASRSHLRSLNTNDAECWKVEFGAGGLICWVTHPFRKDGMEIEVLNPLTGGSRILPPTLNRGWIPAIVKVFMDERTKTYKIILVGNCAHRDEDERYQITEIYDGALGSWKHGGRFLPYRPCDHYHRYSGRDTISVEHKGVLYFVLRMRCRTRGVLLYLMLAYNIERDLWSETPHILPKVVHEREEFALVKCEGRLLLARIVSRDQSNNISHFNIFELNISSKEWVPLFKVPVPIDCYPRDRNLRYRVISLPGNQLAITKSMPQWRAEGVLHVWLYDMVRKSTRLLASCPLYESLANSFHPGTDFSFRPALLRTLEV